MKQDMIKPSGHRCVLRLWGPGLALGWVVILISGCAVIDPTDPYAPVASPRAPSASSLTPVTATVAATTNGFSAPLTLSDCLALAARNNPGLAAAGDEARAAEARRKAARAGQLPTLSAEGSYTRNLDRQRLTMPRSPNDPISFSFSEDLFRGELVTRLPLFTGGRLRNEVKAAALASEASLNQAQRTAEELTFEVSRAFYSILAWEKAIGALEFSKNALVEHRRKIQSLLEAQKAAEVDLLRTDVRLASVEQDLVSARNTLAVQRHVLVTAMGLPATEAPLTLAGTLDFREQGREPSAAVAQAMTQRADYLAARKQLEAQGRRVDIARAGRAPVLGAFGSYGGRSNTRDEVDVGSAGVAQVGSLT